MSRVRTARRPRGGHSLGDLGHAPDSVLTALVLGGNLCLLCRPSTGGPGARVGALLEPPAGGRLQKGFRATIKGESVMTTSTVTEKRPTGRARPKPTSSAAPEL